MNVTFSNVIRSLGQLHFGIQIPDPVKAVNFQKHVISKKCDYFK